MVFRGLTLDSVFLIKSSTAVNNLVNRQTEMITFFCLCVTDENHQYLSVFLFVRCVCGQEGSGSHTKTDCPLLGLIADEASAFPLSISISRNRVA